MNNEGPIYYVPRKGLWSRAGGTRKDGPASLGFQDYILTAFGKTLHDWHVTTYIS